MSSGQYSHNSTLTGSWRGLKWWFLATMLVLDQYLLGHHLKCAPYRAIGIKICHRNLFCDKHQPLSGSVIITMSEFKCFTFIAAHWNPWSMKYLIYPHIWSVHILICWIPKIERRLLRFRWIRTRMVLWYMGKFGSNQACQGWTRTEVAFNKATVSASRAILYLQTEMQTNLLRACTYLGRYSP